MSEAFKKQLKRCRTAHLWTGIVNAVSVVTAFLLVWLVWAMMRYMPGLINSELYTDEQRQQWNEVSGKLPWVLGILGSFLAYMALVTFLAFHVMWCLGKGRYRTYCQVASWVQALNVPMGTGIAIMALKLMWSEEGKAHFGGQGSQNRSQEAGKEIISDAKGERGSGIEGKPEANESETQD